MRGVGDVGHGCAAGQKRSCAWSVNLPRKLRRFEPCTSHRDTKEPLISGNADQGLFRRIRTRGYGRWSLWVACLTSFRPNTAPDQQFRTRGGPKITVLERRRGWLAPAVSAGRKHPVGLELVKHFGVVRGTVDKALDLLRTEGLMVTRQGSGSFVRDRTSRPVGAPAAPGGRLRVAARAAGQGPLRPPRAGVHHGPAAAARHDGTDGRARPRLRPPGRSRPPAARPQHRPLGRDAPRTGPRPEGQRPGQGPPGIQPVQAVHPERDGGVLRLPPAPRAHRHDRRHRPHLLRRDRQGHHVAGPDDASLGSQYVQQAQMWFDSVWSTIAYERQP
ncbi:GntR family transcriptional regulator [Kitasatospora sp. NPDC101183]|uniref:GntR family transcriptional regulator n=1 Tax=Kitasatospora sp. NPDC101183 TaxID=3364100 RepID=UPI0037FE428F